MDDHKIVWIASMPRSGSMWVFNLTRAMLEASGRSIRPTRISQRDRDMFGDADRALEDSDPNTVWVLKVHSTIARNAPKSRFIYSFRDPRDALISFMRFMDFDFDTAVRHIPTWIGITDHFANFPDSVCCSIDYADIVDDPIRVASVIARFLGLSVSAATLDTLVKRFSRENVQTLISRTEAELRRRASAGETLARDDVVLKDGKVVRVFDTSTGFQTGHITGYRDGDWRSILDDEQKRHLETEFGAWLRRRGYATD